MIATLGRTATGYTIANEKKYDVWGAVRQSQSPGSHVVNPNKQYCANLGHTFDGESDLIYMRARYYEPSTGRFLSEDPMCHWINWYAYGANNPVSFHDESGTVFSNPTDKWKAVTQQMLWWTSIGLVYAAMYSPYSNLSPVVRILYIESAIVMSVLALDQQDGPWALQLVLGILSTGSWMATFMGLVTGIDILSRLPNGKTAAFWAAYSCLLLAGVMLINFDSFMEDANYDVVPGL